MVIIATKTIRNYWEKNPASKLPLQKWASVVKNANWSSFNDVKKDFSTADYVGNDRIVFNIKGNDYRLIAVAIFRKRTLFVRFIGTHKEYDKIVDIKNI